MTKKIKVPDKRIETRKLTSLKPHPKQACYFTPPTEQEIADLAEDIKANGLLNPIEILADGVMIAGHTRKRALELLGIKQTDCWIRDDLEQAGVAAIENRLIMDNRNRRQLTALDKARCYLALKRIPRKYVEKDITLLKKHEIKGDLRDHFAKDLHVSGRTLDRWAAVLTTPIEVQQAFDSGQLPLSLAQKVAAAPKELQQQIAAGILAGEEPKNVVLRLLPAAAREKTFCDLFPQQVRRLESFLEQLRDNLTSLTSCHRFEAKIIRRAATEFESAALHLERLLATQEKTAREKFGKFVRE